MIYPNLTKIQNKYEEEILSLVDNQDDYTRSDLQGVVSAIVFNIIRATEKIVQEVKENGK